MTTGAGCASGGWRDRRDNGRRDNGRVAGVGVGVVSGAGTERHHAHENHSERPCAGNVTPSPRGSHASGAASRVSVAASRSVIRVVIRVVAVVSVG